MVVAEDAYVAEDAADLVRVAVDPTPPVVDPRQAVRDDAPRVHAGQSNVAFERHVEQGDVDALLAAGAVRFQRTLRTSRCSAAPMEPRGLLVAPEADGICVWASTQVPYLLRDQLAEQLGLAADAVRVVAVSVGGGFGQKAHVYVEDVVVAALALRLQRPVRWTEDRAENLMASSHARDQVIRVDVSADAEGRLLAIDADVAVDVGAYGVYAHAHVIEAGGTPAMIPGPYRLAGYRYRSRAVCTNKVAQGGYRGVGMPLSAFVHERIVDTLAGEIGLDPVEVRRRNLVRPDEMPYRSLGGHLYDGGDYPQALERAAAAIGHGGSAGRGDDGDGAPSVLSGIGFASIVEFSGMNSAVFRSRGMRAVAGVDGAHVRLDEQGRAEIWTSIPGIGQGTLTTFAQIAADALGLPLEQVVINPGDTAVGGLRGTGAMSSRSAVSGGGAIQRAAEQLRGRLAGAMAERCDLDVDRIEVRDGRVGDPDHWDAAVPVAELVREHGAERFAVTEIFDPAATTYGYGTHACEVEVDVATGAVSVRRYVVADDCGRIINPLIVAGQVQGGVAQGIGEALYERHEYDAEGQLQTGSFMDYLLPTACDVPVVEPFHVEAPVAETATGARGAGESGAIGSPAAVANAVSDAVGVAFDALPITPEQVLRALRVLSPQPEGHEP